MSRLSNFLIAAVLLAFTLPLILFIALAIKCESRGPVFDRQRRVGAGARAFYLLTFRTTLHDPEDRLPIWARRTTHVGGFLCYTRIVALPQLINILRGEISFLEGDGWPSPFWD
jgi:lipopolysaccharide/colanic/teichoic acid biosynthesis glycosyltransferase